MDLFGFWHVERKKKRKLSRLQENNFWLVVVTHVEVGQEFTKEQGFLILRKPYH